MAKSTSNRIITTPSSYAKKHYLYVQEVGTLQSIEPHVSRRQNLNSYLFFVVLQGSGNITYEGRSHSISSGDCVWLDCTKSYSHESSADDPWSLMWVHFTGPEASGFYSVYRQNNNPYLFHPTNPTAFTDLIRELFDNQQHKTPLTELYDNRLLTDMIAICFQTGNEKAASDYSTHSKLQQIRTHLEEHYQEKINLEDLSSRFFISKYHLSREYKKIYGVTIGNDLTAIRISHAKSLLRFTEDPVESIALSCGFQEAGYFIKVFRKSENMTPLEYRKKW